MDPNTAFSALFSLPIFVLCVILGLVVASIRKVVESSAKRIDRALSDKYEPFVHWLWREFVLPALPIVLGALVAYYIKDYPFPEPFKDSNSARVFVGGIAGLVSSFMYPRVMFFLKKFAKNSENK